MLTERGRVQPRDERQIRTLAPLVKLLGAQHLVEVRGQQRSRPLEAAVQCAGGSKTRGGGDVSGELYRWGVWADWRGLTGVGYWLQCRYAPSFLPFLQEAVAAREAVELGVGELAEVLSTQGVERWTIQN